MLKRKIIYIESCDFESYPLGGTLSFSKQFIDNIQEELYLVGLGRSSEPIGTWFKKHIGGKEFNFFSIGTVEAVSKSRLPKRIVTYLLLKKYIKELYQKNFDVIFTQTPQFVFLISKFKWSKFCFCFAGLGNSVGLSKYKILRPLGGIYEYLLFRSLKKKL